MAKMNRVVTLDRVGQLSNGHTVAAAGAIAAGHARVRVRRVGLCGTDFHAFHGRQPFVTYPRILGHELGVEVIDLATDVDDETFAPGTRCAVEPYLNCGSCHACRAGRTNCCVSLQVLGVHCDGGLQDWLDLPASRLHASSSLSFDALALVEPLSIGAHAVRRAQLRPRERVLVIGCGPIGYATMAAACAAGARVWAVDRSDDRLRFCAARLPLAGTSIIAGDAAPIPIEGEPPMVVFDTTGNAASMTKAFDLVPAAGRLIFVGLVRGSLTFDDPEFHRRELTVLASRNATAEDFRQVMTWIETGAIDPQSLVTHRIRFTRLVDEFPVLLEEGGRVFKTLVELEGSS